MRRKDGSSCRLGPGEYLVIDDGPEVEFVGDVDGSSLLGVIDRAQLSAMLTWRQAVFTSW